MVTAKVKVSGSNCAAIIWGHCVKGEGNGVMQRWQYKLSQAVMGEVQQFFGCVSSSTANELGQLWAGAGVLLSGGISRWLVKPFFVKGAQYLGCFSIFFLITACGGSSLGAELWLACLQYCFVTAACCFIILFVSYVKWHKYSKRGRK